MSIGMAMGENLDKLDKQKDTLQDINQFEIKLVNYEFKNGLNINPLVASFNITEDINSPHCSVELVIQDATNLKDRLPIVGEELIIFTYKSRGLPKFPKVIRSFRIIKVSDYQHATEKMIVYKVFGIDDHYHVNEGIDVNSSFAGQNCIKAADNVFKSYFTKASFNFRPSDKQEKLYGYEAGSDVVESQNSSSFISTGLTPIEVIKSLASEAEHKDPDDTSHYTFYQNATGFHLTTTSEMKKQKPKFSYFLKDPNLREMIKDTKGSDDIFSEQRLATGTHDNYILGEKNHILAFTQRCAFDQVQNINNGFYGNRVVAIDPLTKKYDERVETYGNRWRSLTPLEPRGGPFITQGEHPKVFLKE